MTTRLPKTDPHLNSTPNEKKFHENPTIIDVVTAIITNVLAGEGDSNPGPERMGEVSVLGPQMELEGQ